KIANVGKIIYTTGGSAEPYKDYKVGENKFSSTMTKVFEERGDVYYSSPLKNDSLAKVVDLAEIKSIKKPKNAIDSGPIYQYVSAIEKGADKKISFEKITDSRYKIAGEVGEGEGVLVQQTYDSGWSVKAGLGQGGGWSKFKDSFDFMILVPKNPGSFEIELVYTKPIGVYVGYLITLVTIGFIIKRFFNLQTPFKKKVS
ncbi:MAG: hypothetical protein Q8P25_01615, partial [Candidatus Curtissbacteria bacterium]|nr:hypothetical protein [Candidatus Curtissbacteria bacterium]